MKPRYITHSILTTIPSWLQTLLWYMRDSMEVPSGIACKFSVYPALVTASALSILRSSRNTSTLSRSRASSLLGLIDYQNALTTRWKKRILQVLSKECEVRGTDATGIAYNFGGSIKV